MSNTNDKIELFKQYKTNNHKDVTLFTVEARGEAPIKGMIAFIGHDVVASWSATTQKLLEKLRDNGIPEQFPLPPEKKGYTWEARGWGWKRSKVRYICINVKFKGEGWTLGQADYRSNTIGEHDCFYIEYIPIPKPVFVPDSEETLAKLPVKEGYKPVYRGKGWSSSTTHYAFDECNKGRLPRSISNSSPCGVNYFHYWEYIPVVTKITMAHLNQILGYKVEIVE